MAKEIEGNISAEQARAIRAILSGKNTDLNKVMAILAEGETTACERDPFCDKFQIALMETYSIIVGRPELLRDSVLRSIAGKIIDLLRGFNLIVVGKG